MVEDAAAFAELFADAVAAHTGAAVDTCVAVVDVELFLAEHRYDLALVDLSFPQEDASGLDALAEIHSHLPDTTLAIMTQGDTWVSDLLRDAWELLPISTIISKTAPLPYQLDMIQQVLDTGSAPIDPAIQTLLPATKNTTRTIESFGNLVHHLGHAKVWDALLTADGDATYRSVADTTGLKLNTVKNYRSQLLDSLRVHGLDEPSLREMQEFARRCRAFLRPHVDRSLGR